MSSFTARALAPAAALLAITTSAGAALAADLPPPPPPYQEMRAGYDWSGFEVGGLISLQATDNTYQPSSGPDPDLNGDGVGGGVLVGYNYQFDNSIVVGVEGDITFTTLDPRNKLDQVKQDVDNIETLRARAGWAHDNTLFYVTGGVGWLHSKVSIPFFGESDSKTHVGYVVGGGIEHGLTDNITARIEYLYGDFGKETYSFTPGTIRLNMKDVHMVRAAAAWKF